MDKRARKYFGLGISAALIFAILFLARIYTSSGSLPSSSIVLILFGTVVGIVISYVLYHSFLERESQMFFLPGEELILKRTYPDKSVIIPQIIGTGDAPNATPDEVNMYLTNLGIAAEPPGSGQPILYIPYSDIQEMHTVNRMLLKYIKIRYLDVNGLVSEVLLYVGNETDIWAQKIGKRILGQI